MSQMLRKKEAFTLVTPIPGFIPRQLAIDILHSHGEVLTLNPLVLGFKPISAPRNASADEFYSTWYEIEERIQVIPGVGKLGGSRIKFNGCFHDMPWGLQTHIYAPLNIDLRNKYRICGNQPGFEPPEVREIGLEALGAPADGLYLREDIEIKTNIAMVSFVKAQLKASNKEMVQRIIKKAELLDAGVLQAMMEDGKLKTVNPNDRSTTPAVAASADPRRQSSVSYGMGQKSPQLAHQGHMPPSYSPVYPHYAYPATAQTPQPYDPRQSTYQQTPQHGMYAPPPIPPKEQMVIMELPGDYPPHAGGLYPSPQPSPGYRPASSSSSDPRWSGQPSPNFNQQRASTGSTSSAGQHPGFVSELATHNEKSEY
ncbi:uncharacterized protein TRIVIDRAFT_90424 [Trichoderma virens Gv29-8]|uniref:DUF7053 domain-containing protein n=1 Tax=Hypocrea virens (strain Gv29-8 / FGSC 10586) TaxID=413071 RepID=G9N2L8_HYPVG|nr:uncharacterized protein TRIVIDRAFT_90424 [Trichoderma virens Gv29-8]EHK19328.1 hypothetical protein TRIVIDRAFT_90424 [Trichoderma virens Gv29-8]